MITVEYSQFLQRITSRALRLTDDGYTMTPVAGQPNAYYVAVPSKDYAFLVLCGEVNGVERYECSCKCFLAHATCKHLEAVNMRFYLAETTANDFDKFVIDMETLIDNGEIDINGANL